MKTNSQKKKAQIDYSTLQLNFTSFFFVCGAGNGTLGFSYGMQKLFH
jgi:hypothetical protein